MAATSDLVAECSVYCCPHLTDAELRASYSDAKVGENVVFQPHDALQAHAPIHEEARGANVHCHPGAAAPTPHRFPEPADSTDSVGVGNAHHRAAQSLYEDPAVVFASEDPIVEVRWVSQRLLDDALIQLTSIDKGLCDEPVVHGSEAQLEQQRECEPTR